jgi:predicted nucleotidyltransferase
MTVQHLHDEKLILLSALSGSHAYGLNHADSDIDLRGVFILPQKKLYGFHTPEQVSDDKNDTIYYELGRFLNLLCKNNPNLLELLAVTNDVIQQRHPMMEHVKAEMFLSKLCRNTFAGYAREQIKKAWGLNKKILNPMEEKRKSILDFCYVVVGHGSKSLQEWLDEKGLSQEDCGLVNVPNMQNLYALFHKNQFEENPDFRGVVYSDDSQEVRLSSIPKGADALTILSYNKNGYSVYCRQFLDYWSWVEKRNQVRYENTIEHGKQYDAKNMMHTFRLLHMAEEIARDGKIIVRRTEDKDFLWKIRRGEFFYQDLVERAEAKLEEIDLLFEKSSLPESPDETAIEQLLVAMREEWYGGK